MAAISRSVPGMCFATFFSHAGDAITSASPMVEHSGLRQLKIPETQPATPQGSADGQQASPLLMSIKKLVNHQEAIEGAAVASGSPAATANSSGAENSSTVLGPGWPNP